ncbi:MAG: ArsR/SmtB family transcription factor [Candidatus Bathyarchaeales archaeon]
MTNEKDDEETYSLIFSSLKHPIRRKILRMLEDGELSFSEILEILGIDSGHLSYHLENLGDLITRTTDGKYRLSSFGIAAVKLMRGVEEYHPSISLKPQTKMDAAIRLFSAILAVSLLIMSFYSINLTTAIQAEAALWSDIPLALAQNQTLSYPVNFIYGERFEARASSREIEIITSDLVTSISGWTEYHIFLNLEFNQSYQLNVTVLESSSKVISSARWDGVPCAFIASTGAAITRSGNYTVNIKNISAEPLSGKMGIRVLQQRFHKPLIYYGLGGLTVVIAYLIAILLIWNWVSRRKHINNMNIKINIKQGMMFKIDIFDVAVRKF